MESRVRHAESSVGACNIHVDIFRTHSGAVFIKTYIFETFSDTAFGDHRLGHCERSAIVGDGLLEVGRQVVVDLEDGLPVL